MPEKGSNRSLTQRFCGRTLPCLAPESRQRLDWCYALRATPQAGGDTLLYLPKEATLAPGIHITTIDSEDGELVERLAQLTYDAFRLHAPDWLPTVEEARIRVLRAAAPEPHNRVLIDEHGEPSGWIGFMSIHHGRIWEVHPLAVAIDKRRKGYGRALVMEVERLAAQQGVLGMYVGTSDITGETSLFGVDLYADPVEAMRTFESNNRHAVHFWKHMGYNIIGVAPDAEGRGKPGITLAKRIG